MQLNGIPRREPTAALDTERGNKVMALLRNIARERHSAVIMVTHDRRMIEGFDTVYHLEDGALSRLEVRAAAEAALSFHIGWFTGFCAIRDA